MQVSLMMPLNFNALPSLRKSHLSNAQVRHDWWVVSLVCAGAAGDHHEAH
jgi:hypothetical protein